MDRQVETRRFVARAAAGAAVVVVAERAVGPAGNPWGPGRVHHRGRAARGRRSGVPGSM